VVDNVILQVAGVLTLNMPLELGQTTESVEVQATATEVTATSSSVGDVMEGKRLTELPLVGRSAYDLLLTQPGVSSGAMINGSGNYYLNGNQGASINFTFDGITAMDNLHNSTFYQYTNVVSVDRTEEFRVVTSPADAEYGRGAGQVQFVTRGGTNRFSGSAWEELRNGDLTRITGSTTPRDTIPTALPSIRAIRSSRTTTVSASAARLRRTKRFSMGSMSPTSRAISSWPMKRYIHRARSKGFSDSTQAW